MRKHGTLFCGTLFAGGIAFLLVVKNADRPPGKAAALPRPQTLTTEAAAQIATNQPNSTKANPTNAPLPCGDKICLGDTVSVHFDQLEKSQPDSLLAGYDETYTVRNGSLRYAGMKFDLMQIGVKSGRVEKIYWWRAADESELSPLESTTTDELNNTYRSYGAFVPKSFDFKNGRVRREWNLSRFSVIMTTQIYGAYVPRKNRHAKIEIIATLK